MTGLGTEQLRTQLETFVARMQRETRVPGVGVAVSLAGRRLAAYAGSRAAGSAEPLGADARYHLGCATKLLLASAALELERTGALGLDATLGEYLPELRGCAHGGAVRVAHLLSHTSGYRGTHVFDAATRLASWQDLIDYLRATPALFAPGTVFSYEHTESVLLAEIVRRVTGRPSLALIADTLLRPLGITPGSFGAGPDARDAGRHRFDERAGGFVPLEHLTPMSSFWLPAFSDFTVTLDELMRITETVAGTAAGPLLAAATRRALAAPVVRLPPLAGGPLRELLPVGFGLGTAEFRDGSHGNTGISPGQCLGLRFDTRTALCVAVTLNATAPHVRDCLLAALCRELGGHAPRRELARFELELAGLAGTYLGPGGGIVVAHRDGEHLICEIGREQRPDRLRVELALDADRQLVLRSPLPHLSLGFFVEPTTAAVGLMLGLSAYRRSAD